MDGGNNSSLNYGDVAIIAVVGIIFLFFQIFLGRKSAKRKIEKLCTLLQSFGIDTQLADKHCPEERIGSRGRSISGSLAWVSGGDSIGVIHISKGSIGWVNVLEYQFGDSPTDHWYIYGIPDPRIQPGLVKVHLKSSELKESWRGKIIGVNWQGEDNNMGIKEWLSQQTLVKGVISDLYSRGIKADLEIDLEPNHCCWIMSTKAMPTLELWNCYQYIASKLKTVTLSAAGVITS